VIQWAKQAIAPDAATVQVRLRDNHLYLLYEAPQGLAEKQTVSQLSAALQQNSLEAYLPDPGLSIDKIFLSSRTQGAKLPDWTVRLDYDEITQSGQSSKVLEKQSEGVISQPPNVPTQQKLEAAQASTPSSEAVPPNKTKKPFITRFTEWFKPQPSQQHTHEDSTPETLTTAETEAVVPSMASLTSSSPAPAPKPTVLKSRSSRPPSEHFAHSTQKSPQSERLAENSILSAPPKMSSSSSAPMQKEAPLHTVSVSQTLTEKDITGEILPSPNPRKQQAQSTSHQEITGEVATRPHAREAPTQPHPNPEINGDVPTISTETLARQGHPAAIASHLSEILGGLGVSVKVRRRNLSRRGHAEATPSKLRQRLWVLCESAYSPDPSLLAEPIAQKLRELKLEHYQDACILLQVQGEAKPDWMLRVDLTPPGKILKRWGRWGDAEAIAVLLNQKLSPQQLQVRATLKESTLHIFCHPHNRKKSQATEPPDQSQVMGIIAPILDKIAPQGIQAATIYGVEETNNNTESDTPLWIDWLNLPAAQQQDLQPSALTLAQQGNVEALKFLINRLINPNLDLKLATGGIRVMLLRKGNVLHVMTEGPTCPSQSKMVPPIRQFLRTAQIQDLTGAKIYGRRSGQKSPLWRYGLNLKSTPLSSETSQMEFAPPTAETDELAGQARGLVFRPNLPLIHLDTEEESFSEQQSGSRWQTRLEAGSAWLQQSLMATGLFSTPDPVLVNHRGSDSDTRRGQKASLALVWGALGCLLVWQADLILAQLVQWQGTQFSFDPVSGDGTTATEFNTIEMSSTVPENISLEYPTFDSPQLDEQLARYQTYIARHQHPPDILVIGSSRALRGVDPAVLEEKLKVEGYGSLKVFNFGVNGATLQVVDLILRRVLPPEQLPKLILIADGVRAVNSGRVDRTYETIAASDGYQQIAEGTLNLPMGEWAAMESEPTELKSSWWTGLGSDLAWEPGAIQQQLQTLSASYRQRDRLKQVLQSWVNQQVIVPPQATPDAAAAESEDQLTENIPALESNGFLPMSVQFKPETYYEKHSKVSGYYDGDYQGFALEGKQITALNTLLEYVQSRGIEVVFVNMPLTQDYLDEVRRDYEQVFRQQMQQLEAQTHLTFIDLGLAWQNQYDYFSDPSHLNQYGAAAVSQRLAQESRISWPR
jgi:lysophospholipase L1-like esterase